MSPSRSSRCALVGCALSVTLCLATTFPASVAGAQSEAEIVFAANSDTAGQTYEVYTTTADGSVVERLTVNGDDDLDPAWSPDRTKIAFTRFSADRLNARIYTMNADGSEVTEISSVGFSCPDEFEPCGGRWIDGDPTWSPDGMQIAFARIFRSGNIYVMNADGTNQRALTGGPNGEAAPDWSPNGRKIVMASHMKNARLDIFTIDVASGRTRRLTRTPEYERQPVWSPDGTRIAFASDRDSPTEDIYDIYVMRSDGSRVRRLTTSRADDAQPTWAPDGHSLVFESNRDGDYDLYRIGLDRSGLTALTTNVWSDVDASWAE